MSARPEDTTPEAWTAQREALSSMGPARRLLAAIDLSEAVREIQIEGVRSRNPSWGRAEAVRWIVLRNLGMDLPRRS